MKGSSLWSRRRAAAAPVARPPSLAPNGSGDTPGSPPQDADASPSLLPASCPPASPPRKGKGGEREKERGKGGQRAPHGTARNVSHARIVAGDTSTFAQPFPHAYATYTRGLYTALPPDAIGMGSRGAGKAKAQQWRLSDFDIAQIDRNIRRELHAPEDDLTREVHRTIARTRQIARHGATHGDRVKAARQLPDLYQLADDVRWSACLGCYLMETRELVREYRALKARTRFSFAGGQSPEDVARERRCAALTRRYLHIARRHIDLSSLPLAERAQLGCDTCVDGESVALLYNEDSGLMTCSVCGAVIESLEAAPTYKDSDRVNMSTRFKYTRRSHYMDAMIRFQARQNVNIPGSVYDGLATYMEERGITLGTLKKDHIYQYLAVAGMSELYNHVALIYYTVTKKPPPDISMHEERLLEIHDTAERIYDMIRERGGVEGVGASGEQRQNSLNVNYKLRRGLQLVGYRCSPDDFHMLKTESKLVEHDQYWSMICGIAGWPFIPL